MPGFWKNDADRKGRLQPEEIERAIAQLKHALEACEDEGGITPEMRHRMPGGRESAPRFERPGPWDEERRPGRGDRPGGGERMRKRDRELWPDDDAEER